MASGWRDPETDPPRGHTAAYAATGTDERFCAKHLGYVAPPDESTLIAALRALAPDARARVIAAAQAPEGGAVEAVRAAVLRLARQHDGIVLVALLRLQVQHLDAATVERSLVELERLRVLDLQIANDPLGPTAEGGWRIDGRGWIAYVVVHEVRR